MLHNVVFEPINNFIVGNLVPGFISSSLPSLPGIASFAAYEFGPVAASIFTAYKGIEACELCLSKDRDWKKVTHAGGQALAVFLATVVVLNQPDSVSLMLTGTLASAATALLYKYGNSKVSVA
jgi:hypothetical protein